MLGQDEEIFPHFSTYNLHTVTWISILHVNSEIVLKLFILVQVRCCNQVKFSFSDQ